MSSGPAAGRSPRSRRTSRPISGRSRFALDGRRTASPVPMCRRPMSARVLRDAPAGGQRRARSTQRPLAPDLGDLPRRRSEPRPGQASAQAQAQSSSALAQARAQSSSSARVQARAQSSLSARVQARAQWSSALAQARAQPLSARVRARAQPLSARVRARAQPLSALAQARAQPLSALAQARAQPLSVLARARWLSGSVLAPRRWLPVRVRARAQSFVGVCSGSAAVVVAGWGARSGSEAHDEASSDSAAAARTAAVSLDDGAMSGPVIRGGRCSQALTRVVGPRSAGPEAPHNCRRCRQHCQRSSDHTNAGRNRR